MPATDIAESHAPTLFFVIETAADLPLPVFDPVVPAADPPPLAPEEPLPEEVPCPLDEPLEEEPVEPPLEDTDPPEDPTRGSSDKLDSVIIYEPPDDPPDDPPDEPPELLPGRAKKSGMTTSARLEAVLIAGILRAEARKTVVRRKDKRVRRRILRSLMQTMK
ncbi:MAG: hypothetical protein Q9222_006643 [Ikaeria aurantiellina]